MIRIMFDLIALVVIGAILLALLALLTFAGLLIYYAVVVG